MRKHLNSRFYKSSGSPAAADSWRRGASAMVRVVSAAVFIVVLSSTAHAGGVMGEFVREPNRVTAMRPDLEVVRQRTQTALMPNIERLNASGTAHVTEELEKSHIETSQSVSDTHLFLKEGKPNTTEPTGWSWRLPKASGSMLLVERKTDGHYRLVGPTEASVASAQAPDVLTRFALGSEHALTIRMTGFNEAEARALLKSMELKNQAHVAGILRGDARLARVRLNFSRAAFAEPQPIEAKDGTPGLAFDVTIPVEKKNPILFHIRMFFRDMTPVAVKSVAARASEAIKRVLKTRGDATGVEVTDALREELKKLVPNGQPELHFRLMNEGSDVVFSNNTGPAHARADRFTA